MCLLSGNKWQCSAVIWLQLLTCIITLPKMQDGWCDSIGSVEDIQIKLLKRQEAAAKRERAMAYALSHQVTLSDVYDASN